MLTPISRRRQAILQDRRRRMLERYYRPKINTVLRQMAKDAAKAYGEGGTERALQSVSDSQKPLQDVLLRLYYSSADTAKRTLNQQLGVKKLDVFSTYLQSLFADYAFDKAISLTETSKEELRRVVSNALVAEETYNLATITKLIESGLKASASYRAAMITRTEVGAAVMESEFAMLDEYDLPAEMVKVWLSNIDGRVRKTHAQVDGQTRNKDDLFDVGGDKLKYPNDRSGSPENVINCRCSVSWELKEE